MLLVALGLVGVLAQAGGQLPGTTLATGRIVDAATGAGIADARVMLLPTPAAGRGLPASVDRQSPTALTDADGRYSFEDVAPGRYLINVQKTGFAPLAQPTASPTVDIVVGQMREIRDIRLQRGGVIVGRVLDERGDPVTGARVMALRKPQVPAGGRGVPPPNLPLGMAGSADVNDLGEFRLFGLLPGEYVVAATMAPMMSERTMPRATTMVPTYFPAATDPSGAQPIVLGSGQTYGDVAIRMLAVPAFQVSGTVRDEAGAPVANALIRLQSSEQRGAALPMMSGRLQIHTDASGRFTVANVTAGTYTLSAEPPIVISRTDARAGGVPGGPTSMTMIGGFVGGGMTTETRNGVTTQWREETATRVPVTVSDANIPGLEIVVRTPER